MAQDVMVNAYEAARQAVAVADIGDWGWLVVNGPDRLDFLHRLSTNDLRGLRPGQGLPTVLTSATGRVIAALWVYAGEDGLYVRTEPGQARQVSRYLNSMIFFNDHAELPAAPEVQQFALFGPGAGELLGRLAGLPGELVAAPYGWRDAEIAGTAVAIQRGGPLALPDWTVVAPRGQAGAVFQALTAEAAVLDAETLAALRVEAGLPAWGHELSDQVTPLETGLSAAISYTKGCYTGQEVIARQTNYDKITRRLAGLILPEGEACAPGLAGAPVSGVAGRPGFIGTVAASPALGRCIALAVVPRDLAVPGSSATIRVGDREITATVAELPFVPPRSVDLSIDPSSDPTSNPPSDPSSDPRS
jgi:folate-binding protein YgfZ